MKTAEKSAVKTPRIKAIGSHVVVRRGEPESRSKGGIVLPEQSQRTANQGIVVAVGTGRAIDGSEYSLQVNVGDRVLLSPSAYSLSEIEVDEENYTVIDEKDILVVLN